MAPHTAYTICTDKSKLNVAFIHAYLTRSYWAAGIPLATVQKAIEGSLCFGVFYSDEQVGFARVITDGATFAYLADVFVIEAHRGRGLSKKLMQEILAHPQLQGLRRILLATRDAHGLYRQFNFSHVANPEAWMQIHQPDVYQS
jgi:GNAT superfamily N-acetyltransferase